MNPLSILALGLIATGYATAINALDEDFKTTATDQPMIIVTPADHRENLAIYAMPGLAISDPATRPHCEPEMKLIATLDHDFAERRIETRILDNGLQIDLYASSLMGTWTLVHNGTDGIACIVNSGTGWTDMATPEVVFAKVDLAS